MFDSVNRKEIPPEARNNYPCSESRQVVSGVRRMPVRLLWIGDVKGIAD